MTGNIIDRRRLRATLRLCFGAEQADELATRLDADETDAVQTLGPVVRLARLSFATNRWLALVKRAPSTAPLHPRLRLPAVPPLALALHLGLDLDVEALARLFGCSTGEISTALGRGREEVDPAHVSPCPEFVAQVGRYRDPTPDRLERLHVLQHLESCERCQLALEHERKTDDGLLRAINQIEESLTGATETTPSRHTLWLSPALLWGGVAFVAVLMVLAGVIGTRRLLAHHQTPVPLVAANRTAAPFSGWLLETSQNGDVEAINLANGVRRMLIQGDPASRASVMISPDRRHIAEMTYSDAQLGQTLRVYSIAGVKQREWTGLDSTGQYQLDSWLNSDEMLVSRLPFRKSGESDADFNQRLSREATLLSFDVRTGAKKMLLQGRVDSASASPDGSHVAISRIDSDGSVTLEIRPVQGEHLGEPVATLPHMTFANSDSPVLWTPDGQRVVFWARGRVDPSTNETPVDVMTLDGTITPIYNAPGNAFGSLLNISPDGKRIIYAEGTTGTSSALWAYWQISIDGGTPQKLMDGGDLERLIPVQRDWSPIVFLGSSATGALVLTNVEPFYLPKSQQLSNLTSVLSYVTLAYGPAGEALGPVLDQFTPADLLGWLPEDTLPATPNTTAAHTGLFRVQGGHVGILPLTVDSRVSPDGTKLLTDDQTYHFSMAVPLPDPSVEMPQLVGAPYDPSWLPDSSGVIGVQHHTTGTGTISRISIYGDTGNGTYALTDFDPAGLGNSTSAAYREPMLSPNGLRYSFFVVDGRRVSLWVSGSDALPTSVASWDLPPDAKVEVPLIAAWVGNDTLVFTQTDEWKAGFPQQVSLRRVTFASDSSTQLETLLSWQARGGEKGVALQELRLSPDQSRLALRLRRFTGTNLSTDRFDSITVSKSADVTQPVEIAKGVAGEGMSWSPDGSELAAFIKRGLQIAFSDGTRVQTIDTGDTTFAYPVWVRPNEIWYQAIEANGQELHYTLRATR